MLSFDVLASFWSVPVIQTNIIVFFNLVGALALGLMVGYERSYHGRAAGMRTYGLVCMASAALTVISGYSHYWFGASAHMATIGDLTRVIQGIVTGIGFLCAGVIMKEGFSISGLTTAASLWATSAIGILVGVGFYGAAMSLAVLSTISMVWMSKLEAWLPSRQAVAMTLRFDAGYQPQEPALRAMASERGLIAGTITIALDQGEQEWRFIAVARNRHQMALVSHLAAEMAKFKGVKSFHLAYARN
jgi:putative Mg2+ transporter-C (MgtC) family protein